MMSDTGLIINIFYIELAAGKALIYRNYFVDLRMIINYN